MRCKLGEKKHQERTYYSWLKAACAQKKSESRSSFENMKYYKQLQ